MPWNCCCKNALNVVAPAVGDLPPEDMQANITSFDNVTSKVNTKHMNAMESYQEHETFEEFKLNPIYLPFGKLLPIKASGDRDELGDTSKLDKSIVADPNTTLDESSVAGSYNEEFKLNPVYLPFGKLLPIKASGDRDELGDTSKLDKSIVADPNTTLDESSVAGSYYLDTDPNTTLDESSVAGSYYLDTDPNTTLDESSVAGSYNLDTDPNTTLDESSVAGPKIRNRTI